jgi:2,3-diketo-5-methylthio-1-phosphopentane phosphatase
MEAPMKEKILISDFDGTMTEQDFFQVALTRLPASARDHWRRYEAGEISHFAALAAIFASLRVSAGEYAAMLGEMGLEDGVAEGVEALRKTGWRVKVASAGCGCYIERILKEHGLYITVFANPGYFSPDKGVLMALSTGSPYFSSATGIDKGAIVRDFLSRGADVAYAGDGPPDLEPLLLLPPARRFARGWLAQELLRLGELFIRFDRWQEVPAGLLRDSGGL